MTAWSEERRTRHKAALANWKPWTKSTGPRTAQGKLRSSMNALRHGRYAARVRRLKSLLAQQRQWLRLVRAHAEHRIFAPNELLKLCAQPVRRDPVRAVKDFCLRNLHDLMLHLAVKEP